jgi:hypothetical protein
LASAFTVSSDIGKQYGRSPTDQYFCTIQMINPAGRGCGGRASEKDSATVQLKPPTD